jgi:hypothetical protein
MWDVSTRRGREIAHGGEHVAEGDKEGILVHRATKRPSSCFTLSSQHYRPFLFSLNLVEADFHFPPSRARRKLLEKERLRKEAAAASSSTSASAE